MKLALTVAITYLLAVGSLVGTLASMSSGNNWMGTAWGAGAVLVGGGAFAFYYWRLQKRFDENNDYW